MKLLITGSNGQLGTELLRQLTLKKSPIGMIPVIFESAEVTAVDIDRLDITDRDAVLSFTKELRPDTIINCAAFTNVDACEKQRDVANAVNAKSPGYLAEAAAEYGAKMIHVSTDYVFSGDAESPRDEDDETVPNTVYGSSKLAGEKSVLTTCPNAVVVRTAWLYGYNGNNFVKTILEAAKKNGALKVVNDQLGNPTSAVDVAHHILKLADSEYNGIFHCTNDGICSWFDFTVEILRLAGINAVITPCTTAEYPRPAPRPAYSALSNRRLRETIGDEMRPWQVAIAEYIQTLSENSSEPLSK